jgi:hypothetical protein
MHKIFYTPEFRYGNLQTYFHFHLLAGRSGVRIAVRERDFLFPLTSVIALGPTHYPSLWPPKLLATDESAWS